MKTTFAGYLPPSQEEFNKLWENAVFVFDTNVLLNLYRYSKDTKQSFFDFITKSNDKIWMPYLVCEEFLRNRIDVIHTINNSYEKILSDIQICLEKSDFFSEYKHHPTLSRQRIIKEICDFANEKIEDSKKNTIYIDHSSDEILNFLIDKFEQKIGKQQESLDEKIKKCKSRYENKIPPGYEDSKKPELLNGGGKYADCLIWMDIIEYAKINNTDIIFITDDAKEDWWHIINGKTLSPRLELLQEFYQKTQKKCYIYKPEKFLEYAKSANLITIDDSVIEETKSVSENSDIKDLVHARDENETISFENLNIQELEKIGNRSITKYNSHCELRKSTLPSTFMATAVLVELLALLSRDK